MFCTRCVLATIFPRLISYKIRHLLFFFCLLLDVKEKADQQASVSSSEGSKKAEVTGQEELKFQSPFDFSALSSVLNVFHPVFLLRLACKVILS